MALPDCKEQRRHAALFSDELSEGAPRGRWWLLGLFLVFPAAGNDPCEEAVKQIRPARCIVSRFFGGRFGCLLLRSSFWILGQRRFDQGLSLSLHPFLAFSARSLKFFINLDDIQDVRCNREVGIVAQEDVDDRRAVMGGGEH